MAQYKKTVDSWKKKNWYNVVAPKLFDNASVADIPATDEQHLINRIIEFPLKDITKNMGHMYINVRLRVTEIRGKTAFTKYIGHSISRQYLQMLVKRKKDLLDVVLPVASRDGVEFTVKIKVYADGLNSSKTKTALRNALKEAMEKEASESDFGPFVIDALFGKVSSKMMLAIKKIAPIKKVEIAKTELKEVFDTEISKKEEQKEEDVAEELGKEEE